MSDAWSLRASHRIEQLEAEKEFLNAENAGLKAEIEQKDAALRGAIADINVLAKWMRAGDVSLLSYWLERMPEYLETDPAGIDTNTWLDWHRLEERSG